MDHIDIYFKKHLEYQHEKYQSVHNLKGDVDKQARFPFWSPFCHIWARIKSNQLGACIQLIGAYIVLCFQNHKMNNERERFPLSLFDCSTVYFHRLGEL